MRADLFAVCLAFASAAEGCGGGGSAAEGADVSPLVRVSPGGGYADVCAGPATGKRAVGSAVEPSLAADPGDARHLVAAWQADRWSDGGAAAIATAVSLDGGSTWTAGAAPFTLCTGGAFERASDPWLEAGADGTFWLSALLLGRWDAGESAIAVSRSVDGGRTFGAPTLVAREPGPDVLLDKEALTVDPSDPRRAWVVWDRLAGLAAADATQGTGPAWLSRTSDDGATWEMPRPVLDPGPDAQTVGSQVLVLPNRSLLLLATVLTHASRPRPDAVLVGLRSTDGGTTWSVPATLASMRAGGVANSKAPGGFRTGSDLFAATVVPMTGRVLVAWQEAQGPADGIVLASSGDGGITWSAPVRVDRSGGAGAFTPTLAASADGRLALTYGDLRNDRPGDPRLLATSWLSTSDDGGATWGEEALGPPFDLLGAPSSDGFFLGDCAGLVAAGGEFVPILVRSGAEAAPSAVFVRPEVTSGVAIDLRTLRPR